MKRWLNSPECSTVSIDSGFTRTDVSAGAASLCGSDSNQGTNIFVSFFVSPLSNHLSPPLLSSHISIPCFLLHLIFPIASLFIFLFPSLTSCTLSISGCHVPSCVVLSLASGCFLAVWSRPVHSRHQIRFAGRHHPSPPAAEQRTSHPDDLSRKRSLSTGPQLPQPGRPVHLAPPRAAHASDVDPQPQLPRGHGHVTDPRTQPHTHTQPQPQPPPPGAAGTPPLSHSRGSALAPRYATLRQPPQPHHAGRLLQPSQPGLATRGLCQRTGKAQLRLTMEYTPTPSTTSPLKTFIQPLKLCHFWTTCPPPFLLSRTWDLEKKLKLWFKFSC